jgi:hypothetical protein
MEEQETPSDSTTAVVLKSVIEGLRTQPGYLLIFGLSLLFSMAGVGLGVDSAVTTNEWAALLAFGALLISMVAAVAVVWRIEPQKVKDPPAPPPPNNAAPLFDKEFAEIVSEIRDDLAKALSTRQNGVFRTFMHSECADFRARTGDWGNGSFAARKNYNALLANFYESAKKSVFSTSVLAYISAWSTPLGDELLRAHKKSDAEVTRIFMFDTKHDVPNGALDIMEKQAKNGVQVLLHFSDSSPFDFPAEVSKDFTIIDEGAAIGITVSFGRDDLAAQWFIEDDSKIGKFMDLAKTLKKHSKPLARFKEELTV